MSEQRQGRSFLVAMACLKRVNRSKGNPVRTKTVTIPAKQVEVSFEQYIGGRIRQERQRQNMTQDDFVAKADISKAYLSEVENGIRSIGLYKAANVAAVLGKDLKWLVGDWFNE